MVSRISIGLVLALFAVAVTAQPNLNVVRNPPPRNETALMARYVVNEAEWTAIASLSVREKTKGYPFANIVSLSDGPKGNGTGVPYIFLTPLDFTGQDLEKDERVTLLVSLIQGNYCKEKGFDPMDPRCARVIFSGRIKQILENDPEYETARKLFFGRHEWLSHMPANHHFYLAKLEIETVAIIATFGGPAYLTPEQYYSAGSKVVEEYARRYR